jgi:hypothetical protein
VRFASGERARSSFSINDTVRLLGGAFSLNCRSRAFARQRTMDVKGGEPLRPASRPVAQSLRAAGSRVSYGRPAGGRRGFPPSWLLSAITCGRTLDSGLSFEAARGSRLLQIICTSFTGRPGTGILQQNSKGLRGENKMLDKPTLGEQYYAGRDRSKRSSVPPGSAGASNGNE